MAPTATTSKAFSPEQKTLRAGPPIDFSFRELSDLAQIIYAVPVGGHPKNNPLTDPTLPRPKGVEVPPEVIMPPLPAGLRGVPFNSVCVRLCNNLLKSLKGLEAAVAYVLDDPSELTWLDLSYNQLVRVEEVILKYPNLQVLYLHGNKITDVREIAKLAALPRLKKLTIHGNPIAERRGYRPTIASMLPQVQNLDFGAITKVDRDVVATFYKPKRED